MTDNRSPTFLGATIPRRALLGGSAIVGAAALVRCSPTTQRETPGESSIDAPDRTPLPPSDLNTEAGYLFFGDEEVRTLEAMVARILPGDEADPGAIQAGVPMYIDRKLETFVEFAEPTYHQGPFAEGYEGDTPPNAGEESLPVPQADLYRYGFQSELTPQQQYRAGLAGTDRLAQTRHGALFADLDEATQDDLLMLMEAVQERSEGNTGAPSGPGGGAGGDAPSGTELNQAESVFGDVGPGSFFNTVRIDTIEGMFSDPAYGGNRGLVGWTMIGWPGAQRSYSPEEMLHGTDKQPTSMEGLTPMNPDRAGGGREALEQPRDGVHSH